MVFIRSDKKGTRSQRIMRNIIWKSIQNRPDDMLIEDIRANAVGYEKMTALHIQKRQGV